MGSELLSQFGSPISTLTVCTTPPLIVNQTCFNPERVSTGKIFFIGNAVFVAVLGKASYSVAAHFCFAAVSVENPHLSISRFGSGNK